MFIPLSSGFWKEQHKVSKSCWKQRHCRIMSVNVFNNGEFNDNDFSFRAVNNWYIDSHNSFDFNKKLSLFEGFLDFSNFDILFSNLSSKKFNFFIFSSFDSWTFWALLSIFFILIKNTISNI